MPDGLRFVEFLRLVEVVSSKNDKQPAPSPELPAPADGEEGEWLTTDTVDDHDGSFCWIIDFQPLWRPALPAGGRACFLTSRDRFASLHRLRI